MHVDLEARNEWIEREKKREKVEFPFKKGRGEGNIGERGIGKINLLELLLAVLRAYHRSNSVKPVDS